MAGPGGAALGLCVTPQCTVIPTGETRRAAGVGLLLARLCLEHPPDLPWLQGVMAEPEALPSYFPHWSRGEFSPLPGAGTVSWVGDGALECQRMLKSLWPRDGFKQVAGHSCPWMAGQGGCSIPAPSSTGNPLPLQALLRWLVGKLGFNPGTDLPQPPAPAVGVLQPDSFISK